MSNGYVTLKIPQQLADEIDALIGKHGFTSRAEIAKEAIINAAKHAQASQLRVNATIQDHKLRIVVQDNGKGFTIKNPFTFTVRRNFGLYDMRRRCQELGGKLEISSEPGQGTCVNVLLPLSRPQTAQPSSSILARNPNLNSEFILRKD